MNTTAPVLAGWSFDPETRVLTVGQSTCGACQYNRPEVGPGRHQVFPWMDCPACKGKGKRGGGKCRQCSFERADYAQRDGFGEYSVGKVLDTSQPLDGGPCPTCEGTCVVDSYAMNYGNARLPQDIQDAVSAAVPVTATVSGVALTHGEKLVGAISVGNDEYDFQPMFTTSDYGTTWRALAAAHALGQTEQFLADLVAAEGAHIRGAMNRVVEVAKPVTRDYRVQDPRYLVMERVVLAVRPDGVVAYRVFRKTGA